MHDFRMERALVFPGPVQNRTCQEDGMVGVTERARHS